jgi:hypothetical protein
MNDGVSQMMLLMGIVLFLIISLACFFIIVIRRRIAVYSGTTEPSTGNMAVWAQKTQKKNPKHKLNFPTTVVTQDGKMDGEAQNISLLGAFVSCQEPLSPGEVFEIIIKLPDSTQLTLPAETVWDNTNVAEERIITRGMSVRFREMSDMDRQTLEKAIEEPSP